MTHPLPTDPGANPSQPPAPAPAPTPAPPAPTPPAPQPAPAPAPAPVPHFVAPVPGQPAPQTPPNGGGTGQQPNPATGAGQQYPDGFPPNTPLAEMSVDQRESYWKYQARKHEQRVKDMGDYDQLKATADEYQRLVTASQTEQERAVAEARRQGHAEALTAAGGQLVEQWFRAAAAGRLGEDSVNALLAGLDRSHFLTAQGSVDTDRVYALVNSVAPPASAPAAPATGTPGQPAVAGAQPVWQPVPPPATGQQVVAPARGPDFGQGQPGAARLSGLARGRELARQRFGTGTTNQAAQ
jgi:hypothetical protein